MTYNLANLTSTFNTVATNSSQYLGVSDGFRPVSRKEKSPLTTVFKNAIKTLEKNKDKPEILNAISQIKLNTNLIKDRFTNRSKSWSFAESWHAIWSSCFCYKNPIAECKERNYQAFNDFERTLGNLERNINTLKAIVGINVPQLQKIEVYPGIIPEQVEREKAEKEDQANLAREKAATSDYISRSHPEHMNAYRTLLAEVIQARGPSPFEGIHTVNSKTLFLATGNIKITTMEMLNDLINDLVKGRRPHSASNMVLELQEPLTNEQFDSLSNLLKSKKINHIVIATLHPNNLTQPWISKLLNLYSLSNGSHGFIEVIAPVELDLSHMKLNNKILGFPLSFVFPNTIGLNLSHSQDVLIEMFKPALSETNNSLFAFFPRLQKIDLTRALSPIQIDELLPLFTHFALNPKQLIGGKLTAKDVKDNLSSSVSFQPWILPHHILTKEDLENAYHARPGLKSIDLTHGYEEMIDLDTFLIEHPLLTKITINPNSPWLDRKEIDLSSSDPYLIDNLLAQIKNIETLKLGPNVRPEFIIYCVDKGYFKHLKSLDISACQVDGATLLKLTTCENLTVLKLPVNSAKDWNTYLIFKTQSPTPFALKAVATAIFIGSEHVNLDMLDETYDEEEKKNNIIKEIKTIEHTDNYFIRLGEILVSCDNDFAIKSPQIYSLVLKIQEILTKFKKNPMALVLINQFPKMFPTLIDEINHDVAKATHNEEVEVLAQEMQTDILVSQLEAENAAPRLNVLPLFLDNFPPYALPEDLSDDESTQIAIQHSLEP